MNTHESEKLSGILLERGYFPTEDVQQADIIVFNTCCIRDGAETKILGNIGAVKSLKQKNKDKIVAVVGCMTEQECAREKLIKSYPFVDIILGTFNAYKLGDAIESILLKHKKIYELVPHNTDIIENIPIAREKSTNAWINISYGCNNFCTYCIVPYVRGRERSRTKENILKDVRKALSDGYKEITLLGQNVNSYGNDHGNHNAFCELLSEIAELDGKFRVRFMTSHPKDFNDEILDVIKASGNLCASIHLPIQSGSNKILKAMNRRYTRERYLEIIDSIRTKIPDAGITTDIIVGFPYEEEEDFRDTMDIVKKVQFANAFMFVYSPRVGTPAATYPQVPVDVQKSRIMELVDTQNEITRSLSEKMVGKSYELLLEDVSPKFDGMLCGRTDSGRLVTVKGTSDMIGSFVKVTITQSVNSALFGEIVNENSL